MHISSSRSQILFALLDDVILQNAQILVRRLQIAKATLSPDEHSSSRSEVFGVPRWGHDAENCADYLENKKFWKIQRWKWYYWSDPNRQIPEARFCKNLSATFDANGQFEHAYDDEHPGLHSDTASQRISREDVELSEKLEKNCLDRKASEILPDSWRSNDGDQNDPPENDWMFSVNGEDVLDEESVQLCQKPERDEESEQKSAPEHCRKRFAVEPVVVAPAGWRELESNSLHFSTSCFYVSELQIISISDNTAGLLHTFPVELSHL